MITKAGMINWIFFMTNKVIKEEKAEQEKMSEAEKKIEIITGTTCF